MKSWSHIGNFSLFRWLSGRLKQKDKQHKESESTVQQTLTKDKYSDRYSCRYISPTRNNYGRHRQSINDFHEEQDDYDMMDDF